MVVGMGYIERRAGESGYRARYRDPLGRKHSRTFARKADAQRFLLEMEADKARGAWIDPRGADLPLAAWVEEFLLLARRLSPTTVQTYRGTSTATCSRASATTASAGCRRTRSRTG